MFPHRFAERSRLGRRRIREAGSLPPKRSAVPYSNEKYIVNETDFNEYFEDIIGVTNDKSTEVQNIKIQLSDNIIPYIISKPIHGSQKISGNILTLELKINYELETLILSYGENIKVIEPLILVDKIKNRINKTSNFY